MGVADRLVLDGAQPEPLVRVVGRLLQPSVVEQEHLGLGIFEIELAVVGAFEAAGQLPRASLRSSPARSRSDRVDWSCDHPNSGARPEDSRPSAHDARAAEPKSDGFVDMRKQRQARRLRQLIVAFAEALEAHRETDAFFGVWKMMKVAV